MKKLLITSTLLALAATVTTTSSIAAQDGDGRRIDRNTPPLATPIGKPVSCVGLRQIRNTRVYGDQVIDFHMAGGKVYRNTLPYSCPRLGFEERFLYKTSISQLCSVDIITVLQSPDLSQGASCGLGRFQPVELPKRVRG